MNNICIYDGEGADSGCHSADRQIDAVAQIGSSQWADAADDNAAHIH